MSKTEEIGEDRISNLPDELIHHILSFSDARLAVQTSVLSKRWKLIWTTLPFLNFTRYVNNFLSHRNHDSPIFKLNFSFQNSSDSFGPFWVHKFISYAISHDVHHLTVNVPALLYDDVVMHLSRYNYFSSTSLKKLILRLTFEFDDFLGESESESESESDCYWNLPSLKTLHLIQCRCTTFKLPESYLISLPSLRTLVIDRFALPDSISLSSLTTLHLASCKLPPKFWDFPALITLTLDKVVFPEDMSEDFFSALVNLRNLTLFFRKKTMADCSISCPQLVNLEINSCLSTPSKSPGEINVLSQKVRNYSSVGFFTLTFKVSEIENVNIKLWDSTGYKTTASWKKMKKYYHRVTRMFPELGSAKILTLDSETIEALSAVSDYLLRFPSPFYNLEYVKVPQGYKDSSISTYLKRYLLGGSPKATIVTRLPQKSNSSYSGNSKRCATRALDSSNHGIG